MSSIPTPPSRPTEVPKSRLTVRGTDPQDWGSGPLPPGVDILLDTFPPRPLGRRGGSGPRDLGSRTGVPVRGFRTHTPRRGPGPTTRTAVSGGLPVPKETWRRGQDTTDPRTSGRPDDGGGRHTHEEGLRGPTPAAPGTSLGTVDEYVRTRLRFNNRNGTVGGMVFANVTGCLRCFMVARRVRRVLGTRDPSSVACPIRRPVPTLYSVTPRVMISTWEVGESEAESFVREGVNISYRCGDRPPDWTGTLGPTKVVSDR